MITQSQLNQFQELRGASAAIEAEVRRERERLIAAFASGVEPGPLKVKVETRSTRSFSYDALVDLLGRADADGLRERLPARESTVLTVHA